MEGCKKGGLLRKVGTGRDTALSGSNALRLISPATLVWNVHGIHMPAEKGRQMDGPLRERPTFPSIERVDYNVLQILCGGDGSSELNENRST